MAVTKYYTVNGRIRGESTNGVSTTYGHDALGSVTGTYDENGNPQNTYAWAPYGTQIAKTGTVADPRFIWNGGSGYRVTGTAYSTHYIRARSYDLFTAAWSTRDPRWPKQLPYSYVGGHPMRVADPSGLGVTPWFAHDCKWINEYVYLTCRYCYDSLRSSFGCVEDCNTKARYYFGHCHGGGLVNTTTTGLLTTIAWEPGVAGIIPVTKLVYTGPVITSTYQEPRLVAAPITFDFEYWRKHFDRFVCAFAYYNSNPSFYEFDQHCDDCCEGADANARSWCGNLCDWIKDAGWMDGLHAGIDILTGKHPESGDGANDELSKWEEALKEYNSFEMAQQSLDRTNESWEEARQQIQDVD